MESPMENPMLHLILHKRRGMYTLVFTTTLYKYAVSHRVLWPGKTQDKLYSFTNTYFGTLGKTHGKHMY